MDVRLPDGTIIQGVPDGTTKADLVAKLKGNGMVVPSEWLEASAPEPTSVAAGRAISAIPRQIGLAARYGLEGLAQAAEVGTEPIRQMVVNPLLRLAGAGPADRLSTGVGNALTAIGLPQPQTADERVIGDASRLVAGSLGMTGAARAGASALTGMGQKVRGITGPRAGTTGHCAGAAGLAGGSVREAGGSEGAQLVSSLGAGVAAPLAAGAAAGVAQRGATALKTALTPQQVIDQNVDQQISLALRSQGIDWAGVSERIKQSMRADVAEATASGAKLDPAATARLLQFRMVPGTQPTRGMVSQDPFRSPERRTWPRWARTVRHRLAGTTQPGEQQHQGAATNSG